MSRVVRAEASSPAPPRRLRPARRSASAAAPRSSEVDCVIVGAGAAGIAAARRLAAAGRSFIADRGGEPDRRALFRRDAQLRRCRSIAARISSTTRTAIRWPSSRRAPGSKSIRRRPASASASAGATRAKASSRIIWPRRCAPTAPSRTRRAARPTSTALSALPRDLGDWRSTVEFALGPYDSGKDLDEISAMDFSRAGDRDTAAFCRQGYGALLAKLAEGMPVQLDTAAKLVDITSRGTKVELSTTQGRDHRRATASSPPPPTRCWTASSSRAACPSASRTRWKSSSSAASITSRWS